jgi:hypothetical protein
MVLPPPRELSKEIVPMRYLSDRARVFIFVAGFVICCISALRWLPGAIAASVQTQVIEEALGNKFCKANLSLIVLGCASEEDAAAQQRLPGYRHFLDPDILKSINYMEREKLRILNLCIAADTDQTSRALALYHMGLLFRTAQEFYVRSNYLELKLTELEKSRHNLTTDELYGLELVDWNELTNLLRNGGKSNLAVSQLDKIDPNSEESKRTIGGVTYFALANELAFRETERQWQQLATFIKVRLPKSGTQVLIALQNAGVPEEIAADIMKQEENAPK